MEALRDTAEDIIDHSGNLIETYYQLMLVKATDKGSQLVAESITAISIGLFLMLAFLFGAVGFAWWLGEMLQDMKAGFFITAGIFLLFVVLLLLFRKAVLFPIFRNLIIRKLYDKAD